MVSGMHAVVIRDTRLHWEERDTPVPGDTELLVAVHAAGLNGADMMQRLGRYPAPPGAPADLPTLPTTRAAGSLRLLWSSSSSVAAGSTAEPSDRFHRRSGAGTVNVIGPSFKGSGHGRGCYRSARLLLAYIILLCVCS